MNPALTPVPPPRYGRRALFSVGAAVLLTGVFFCVRIAAANQVGASDAPAAWALYLAGVALYYAAICLFLWCRAKKWREAKKAQRGDQDVLAVSRTSARPKACGRESTS